MDILEHSKPIPIAAMKNKKDNTKDIVDHRPRSFTVDAVLERNTGLILRETSPPSQVASTPPSSRSQDSVNIVAAEKSGLVTPAASTPATSSSSFYGSDSRSSMFLLNMATERPPDPGPAIGTGEGGHYDTNNEDVARGEPQIGGSLSGDGEDESLLRDVDDHRCTLLGALGVGQSSPPPSGSRAPSSTPNHSCRNRTPHSAVVSSSAVQRGRENTLQPRQLPSLSTSVGMIDFSSEMESKKVNQGHVSETLDRSFNLENDKDEPLLVFSSIKSGSTLSESKSFINAPAEPCDFVVEEPSPRNQWHDAINELQDPRQMAKPRRRPKHPTPLVESETDLGAQTFTDELADRQSVDRRLASQLPVTSEVKLLREQLSSAPSPAGSLLFWSEDLSCNSDDDGAIAVEHCDWREIG
jgi:hypothetical protein